MPLGPWEIAALLFVCLLLFGAKRLPELGKGMGSTLREFKRAVHDVDSREELRELDR